MVNHNITMLSQLLQMVVGCNVNFLAYRYKTEGEDDGHQFVFLMAIMINEDVDEINCQGENAE